MKNLSRFVEKVLEFLELKHEGMSLKYIFDHIRNLGLAAVVSVCGFNVMEGDPVMGIPLSQAVIGAALFIGGWILALLNALQSIVGFKHGIKSNIILFYGGMLLLYLITYSVFYEQVRLLIFGI